MLRQERVAETGEIQGSLYRRPSRVRRLGALLLTAGGAFAVACGGSSTATEDPAATWVESDGAAGRINMDDVQQAYKDAYSSEGFDVKKFEQRVNEIFEGDNPVIVEMVRTGDVAEITGWEDLNADKALDTATDDRLFTITQQLKDGGGFETQGHGANNYYYNSSPFGGFFTGLLIGNLLSGGFGGGFGNRYTTPTARYDENVAARSNYRSGPGYSAQQARNASYGGSIGTRFGNSAANATVSPARSSYQQRQINSGGFRSSGSSSRSIGGAKGSAPGGGTISGGGGSATL
jgi:hypothetical protein